MKVNKKLAVAATAAAALVVGVLVATAGRAAANTGDSRTTVTTLVNHPDNSEHGLWAVDNFTRTVTITEGDPVTADELPVDRSAAPQVAIGWSHYKATVEDTGTFVTNAGATLSPARGENLVGNLPGTFSGHYTVYFIAVDDFLNFKGSYDGGPYSGTNPSRTSDFVKGDWGGPDFIGTDANGKPNSDLKNGFDNKSWSWTYKTCNETWVDAWNNGDGTQEPEAGDITGATECPKPSPSPSQSPTPSPTPTTPSPTPTTPAPTPTTGTGTVTVTG